MRTHRTTIFSKKVKKLLKVLGAIVLVCTISTAFLITLVKADNMSLEISVLRKNMRQENQLIITRGVQEEARLRQMLIENRELVIDIVNLLNAEIFPQIDRRLQELEKEKMHRSL